MKIIRLRRYFPLSTVLMYAALFCVSTYALLEHTSISIPVFSWVKFPLLYAGGICLLGQLSILWKSIFRRRHFHVLLSLLALCGWLVLTMLVNRSPDIGTNPMRSTLRLVLYLLELFLVMMVAAEKGEGRQVVNFLFWYVLILVALTDFLLFTRIITFWPGRFETYLVGSKFAVVYQHMNLLTLWVMRSGKSVRGCRVVRRKVLLAAAFIMAVAVRVDCMTGVLGCGALVVLFMLLDSPRQSRLRRFASPATPLLLLAASVVFVFVAEGIMAIPLVEYLIEDVLGRSTTLTGRTNIYASYVDKMDGHWLAGFGFGNGNAAAVRLFGYENVQNALLQWVLQVGVFASGALVFLMLHVFRQVSRMEHDGLARIMPLLAMIYMFIILGAVETTFSMAFIMWIALAFMLANGKQPAPRAGAYIPEARRISA